MRVLFVTNETGWPENTGYRIRIANIARALALLGEVDWIVLSTDPLAAPMVPPELGLRPRVARVYLRSRAATYLRWARGREPWRIAAVDLERTRELLRATEPVEALAAHDLIFATHLDTELIERVILGRAGATMAVDIDNVESSAISHELEATGASMSMLRRFAKRMDRDRWRRIELDSLDTNDVTFVCSDLDRSRMSDRSVVLPNGAPLPSSGYERRPSPDHPVLVFVGAMSYAPNIDAVEYFAREVFPRVRATYPDAEFRIVGRHAIDRVRALEGLDNVTVVGAVDSVETELAAAHLAVAPVRFGGGTRVKILEALAYAVPVVTTTVGCEGIGIETGVHACIADDAITMANACVALLADPARARQLASTGQDFVQQRFLWPTIVNQLADTLREVVRTRVDGTSAPPAAQAN